MKVTKSVNNALRAKIVKGGKPPKKPGKAC